MRLLTHFAEVLLGGIVTLIALPFGFGPAVGGWFAGRRTSSPGRGAITGGVAGALGAFPWAVLVYLASAGAIDSLGYHEGYVRIGIHAAAPETFALWQEVGLAALVFGSMVAIAVAGGVVAGLDTDVAGELRDEFAALRDEFSNGA